MVSVSYQHGRGLVVVYANEGFDALVQGMLVNIIPGGWALAGLMQCNINLGPLHSCTCAAFARHPQRLHMYSCSRSSRSLHVRLRRHMVDMRHVYFVVDHKALVP